MSLPTVEAATRPLGSLVLDGWQLSAGMHQMFISRWGGQVLSLRLHGREVLWASPCPKPLPAALRAGIPLCWPWFGPAREAGQPQHGWVRTHQWTLAQSRSSADGVALTLRPDAPSTDLQVEQSVSLGRDGVFHQRLVTTLAAKAPAPQHLSQALHTYLVVDGSIRVHGLPGLAPEALDLPPSNGQPIEQLFGPVNPGVALTATGASATWAMRSDDATSVMVWNPGTGAGLIDAPDPEPARFICIEVGHMRNAALVLQPGQSCTLSQTLSLFVESSS